MELNRCLDLFKEYAYTFDMENDHISMKYDHSFRVMEYAKDIAISIGLNDDDVLLATVCGLLHDIGRFMQYKTYKTYVDSKSRDHGDLGYEVLIEDDFIDKFTTDEREKEIILNSVKEHNKYRVRDGLDDETLIFCNIIRDADKLDIMETQENTLEDGYIEISDELFNNIYDMELIHAEYLHQISDYVFKYLAFIFDFNFPYSYKVVIDKNIIKNKVDLLREHYKDKDKIDKLDRFLDNYLKEKTLNL